MKIDSHSYRLPGRPRISITKTPLPRANSGASDNRLSMQPMLQGGFGLGTSDFHATHQRVGQSESPWRPRSTPAQPSSRLSPTNRRIHTSAESLAADAGRI